jgi:NTE family protein
MGAYVGAIWACGHDGSKLEELAREMEVKRALWTLLDPVVIPRQGLMRGLAVKHRLQRTIGSARFTDTARTLRVVAAQLDTMERIVFSTGDVATAVHASIAVPGICIPVHIGDEVYVDGGIVDPLPTDVLQEMGVDKIIAVNTIPTPERIRYCMQLEHELERSPARPPSLFSKLLPHRRHVNHYAQSNILDILMHSTHGAQMRMAEAGARRANIVLHPDMCDDRWLDFRNPGFYIQSGREVALRQLDEIKNLIKTKGASYEHQPSPHPLAEIIAR